MREKLEKIVNDNDIKSALKLIKSPKKTPKKSKRRSFLMVSAHNVKHLLKITSLNADTIILNLEDGVSKDKKEIARVMIGVILTNFDIDKEIIVRVNSLKENGLEDIKFLNQFDISSFRIPKVDNINELEEVFKLTDKNISLSIETKESFFSLSQFNHKRIDLLFLGIYDLFNELNLNINLIKHSNPLISKILTDFSLNSRYINKTPIGFVYQHYKDLEGFKKWALLQKEIGIKGVVCITPKQVEIANLIFNEDLEYAKMITKRFEKEGVFTIDGLFVDEPIYKNFKSLINE